MSSALAKRAEMVSILIYRSSRIYVHKIPRSNSTSLSMKKGQSGDVYSSKIANRVYKKSP